MTEAITQRQAMIGYLGAALLAYGALGPIAYSSFFGTRFFLLYGAGEGLFLLVAAAASAVLVYLRKYEWLWLTAGIAGLLWFLVLIGLLVGTEAGQAQWAALPLGAAFTDFQNTYWGSLRFGWGAGVALLGVLVLALAFFPARAAAKARLSRLAGNKVYDIVMALPLVLFYWRIVVRSYDTISLRLSQIADGSATLNGALQLLAVVASDLFSLLLIILIFMRSVPIGKAKDLIPRVIAILGTFAVTAITYLPAIDLPLGLQALAVSLIIVGMALSFLVLLRLGRSFSIMPEARKLVTGGPYAIVRHPLYMVEEIAVFGILIQFASPFALGLGLAHLVLQYMRTEYEERVLSATFPEYDAYRRKVRWRFIPGIL